MSVRSCAAALAVGLASVTPAAAAATWHVGPGQTLTKPCQAIGMAVPGDVIEVDAAGNGTYDGDACAWSTDNLTIRGINGRASINAGGDPTQVSGGPSNVSGDKGIFVINPEVTTATIENFELSGAVADTCPHGQGCSNNGAGIRMQGLNLTVTNCYLHDNQDGLLTGPPTNGQGTILVQFSELARNGQGDGYSHNLYIGQSAVFTLQYSYSHESVVGHLVKSRAWENHIQYNLIADLADGTGSYEVDLPQGGLSYLIGNAIEQGPLTGNPALVSYAEETQANPTQSLFLINNTLVNDLGAGVFLQTGGTPQVTTQNNIFHGAGSAPAATTALTNWTDAQGDPQLNAPTIQDYTLKSTSPCIDAGSPPGTGLGQSLIPAAEYAPAESGLSRDNSHWDLGAFEFGDIGSPIGPDAGLPATTSGASTTGGTSATGATSTGATTGGSTSSASSSDGAVSSGSTSGTSGGARTGGTSSIGATSGSQRTSGRPPGSDGGAPESVSGGCSTSGGNLTGLAALAALTGMRRRRRD